MQREEWEENTVQKMEDRKNEEPDTEQEKNKTKTYRNE